MSAEILREAAALMRERAESDAYANTPHIASCHPDVALAVADVLDLAAQWVEDHPGSWPPANKAALAVARTYLGRDT